jgi:GrpB-like predicted nucleotidyltransferase (UPF0157 family)/quercetin dioxygenase-like cupin family protein
VQLFRFDEEVSRPSSELGPGIRLAPLTGDDSRGRIEVIHVPPHGSLGPRVAPARQMLAIVAGAGWVSGADGERRDVRVGRAVVWEAGEEQAAWTDEGLTAICISGEFETWAAVVTRTIVVSDYDPQWPGWFETLCRRVWPAVEDIALRIDHVGSTAVPGLAAKPIIDMDIVVATEDGVRPVIERLTASGFRWRGDLGIPGREAFNLLRDEGLPPHQLYLVVENNRAHADHVLLRDLLRQDGDARARYAALKRRNVELAAGDIDIYVAAKARLVAELLTRARAERGLPPVTYWDPDVPARDPDPDTGK